MALGDLVKSDNLTAVLGPEIIANLGSLPLGGNLLVAGFGSNNFSDPITATPDGFKKLFDTPHPSPFAGPFLWYYKVSNGDEQTCTAVFTLATFKRMVYVEYEWDGSEPHIVKHDNTDNLNTVVSSQSSGAINVPPSPRNLLLALHCCDQGSLMFVGQAVDGAWIEDFAYVDDTFPGIKFSRLVNSSGLQEATHSDTDTGDKSWGAIAAFTPTDYNGESFIQLPSRFTVPELLIPGRKPIAPVQINTQHQYAKGLVECCLFKNATLNNLVDNVNTINYPSNDAAIVGFVQGGMEHDTSTGAGTQVQSTGFDGSGIKTVTIAFEHLGTGDPTPEVYYEDGQVEITYITADRFRIRTRTSATFGRNEFIKTRVAGEVFVITAIFHPVGTVFPVLFVNGAERVSTTNAGSGTINAFAGQADILSGQTGIQKTNCRIQFYALHNYAMRTSEVTNFHRNVYQLLMPAVGGVM